MWIEEEVTFVIINNVLHPEKVKNNNTETIIHTGDGQIKRCWSDYIMSLFIRSRIAKSTVYILFLIKLRDTVYTDHLFTANSDNALL